MNKKLLLSLALLPLIAGCTTFDYVPSPDHPWVPDPDASDDPGGDEPGGGGDEEEYNLTVYFFLDYSHSEVDEDDDGNKRDNPGNYIYKMEWYALKPLGAMPAEAAITDSMAADSHYSHFIGYSRYSSALDEDLLWNWETDFEASNTLNLYGIWVAQ